MPMPSSATSSSASPSCRATRTRTVPPWGLYLTALPSRLCSTSSSRSASASTGTSASGASTVRMWRGAGGLARDRLHQLALPPIGLGQALLQHAGIAQQRRERRAQLVRGNRQELLARLERRFDLGPRRLPPSPADESPPSASPCPAAKR